MISKVSMHYKKQHQDTGNILLVENDLEVAAFASATISSIGFACIVANDGQEALEVLKNVKFDLVFLDVNIPLIDGFEITRNIREGENISCPDVPIIALTSTVTKELESKCLDAGMNMCIAKPLERETVSDLIKNDKLLLN